MKTLILLRRETSLSLKKDPRTLSNYEGFLLKVSVTKTKNITPKIFVMQRDVASNYIADGVLDAFFSVASIGELEWIPESAPNPHNALNFYRTDAIDLMFETREELEDAWNKIKLAVSQLSAASDSSNEIAEETMYAFPEVALPMFYGVTDLDLTQSQIVHSLSALPSFTNTHSFSYDISRDSYAYFVIHRDLMLPHEASFLNNGTEVPHAINQVTLSIGDEAWPELYMVYRSAEKIIAPQSGTLSFLPK